LAVAKELALCHNLIEKKGYGRILLTSENFAGKAGQND
jgi:hypothetical protein